MFTGRIVMTGVGVDEPAKRTICHDLVAGIGNLWHLADSQPQTLGENEAKTCLESHRLKNPTELLLRHHHHAQYRPSVCRGVRVDLILRVNLSRLAMSESRSTTKRKQKGGKKWPEIAPDEAVHRESYALPHPR